MKAIFTFLLLFLLASVVAADDEKTVSSDSIIDGLIGDKQTRAILVRKRQSPEGMSIDLTIEFEFGSTELTNEARNQLVQLQKALVNPQLAPYSFELIGHTDAQGDAEYNQRLSLDRAQQVRRFLLAGGVEEDRLIADGRGESELLYPHKPDDSRNRRVEITNLGLIKD